MALSKLESHIIVQIADSQEKLSAYDFTDIAYYANVHKSCSKLVNVGLLEYDYTKNEKGASKKIFRLTSYGFCKYVVESDLFWGSKKFGELKNDMGYPADRLERLDSFLQRWKHLHEAFDCFYTLFLKHKGDGNKLLTLTFTFYLTCKEIVDQIEQLLEMKHVMDKWVSATGGNIPDKGENNLNGMVAPLLYPGLIEKFLTLSSERGIGPFFVDFLEILKDGPGADSLKDFFKEKMWEYEIMEYYYKKCFP